MTDLSIRTSNVSYFSRVHTVYNRCLTLVIQHFRTRNERKEARAAFMNICRLDDKMLEDIGVRREEVDWALNLPLEVNASKAMYMKAHQRRDGEK